MKNIVKSIVLAMLTICLGIGLVGCGSGADQVVIYSNADEEAQKAVKEALNQAGYEGQYIMQSFGTSELGGKLMAEGKNIEADLVTMSSYYLDSAQKEHNMFVDLAFQTKALANYPTYYAPITAQAGAIFINKEVLEKHNLPLPTSLKDLAKPAYKGYIAVPDIMGSSTAWLLVQAVLNAYGDTEGMAVMQGIIANAGPHLEKSGSGPLKKIRAGEVAIGFGLRHQAASDKKAGLPIDYVDPAEGSFLLTESVAVVNKNEKKNQLSMKMAEVILKNARPAIIAAYPVALYEGESVSIENQLINPQTFKEALTVELLKKHQSMLK